MGTAANSTRLEQREKTGGRRPEEEIEDEREGKEKETEKADKVVQRTDEDASVSRLSAVEVGYLEDPFAKLFVDSRSRGRRFPIINRGIYTFFFLDL